ncbi:MAG TPA: TIGR04552 family protein [Polyangiaceae bacterium]|nr:TIGR04552 family protein [Polyangiaceae bacterium]
MNDVYRDGGERLKALEDFTLGDLESLRLILRGDSVIDWRRIDVASDQEVRDFLEAQELRPEDPSDRSRMEHVKNEAIAYLRRQFDYPIPRPVDQSTVPELLLLAAGRGHRAMCACTILKCMHIIHHLDGRELLFVLPMSDQEVFHIVEEKVYRVIGGMLAGGFPIVEFVGGRKNKDSLVTKLLSKQETIAAQIFDKLRFRVVTRTRDDIFPVLQYLTKKLFPFNYVVPGQSINSVFGFKSYVEKTSLKPLLGQMQVHGGIDDGFTPSDNQFSAESYRIIHFVVDMPVRLPKRLLDRAPAIATPLGNVIFVICEFQIVDRDTEAHNEIGEASHAKYKERQKKAVMRRLQLGGAGESSPGGPVNQDVRRKK